MPTLRRLIAIAATTAVAVLVLAAPAFAYNDGRGLYGATDDKVVTNAGFILIGAIPLFILFASLGARWLATRSRRKIAQAGR